jgi:hypothetical protein
LCNLRRPLATTWHPTTLALFRSTGSS